MCVCVCECVCFCVCISGVFSSCLLWVWITFEIKAKMCKDSEFIWLSEETTNDAVTELWDEKRHRENQEESWSRMGGPRRGGKGKKRSRRFQVMRWAPATHEPVLLPPYQAARGCQVEWEDRVRAPGLRSSPCVAAGSAALTEGVRCGRGCRWARVEVGECVVARTTQILRKGSKNRL